MILKGTDLMLFIKVNTAWKSIGYATNHTLSLSANASEISTKDSGGGKWTEQIIQKLNWSTTTENLYSYDQAGQGYNDLFTIMVARTPVEIKFALESGYEVKPDNVPSGGWTPIAAPVYSGSAYITDLQLNAPDGDNASFTATLTGSGAISITLPVED